MSSTLVAHRTDVGVLALVDVGAVVGGRVPPLAGGTLAGEGPGRVDAAPAAAQPGHGQALVYVLGNKN